MLIRKLWGQPREAGPGERPEASAAVPTPDTVDARQEVGADVAAGTTVKPPAAGLEKVPEGAEAQAASDLAEVAKAQGEGFSMDQFDGEVSRNTAYGRAYFEMKKQIESDETLKDNPIATGMLALLALASKFETYADLFPGRFMEKLDESPLLEKEVFSEEDIKKIIASKRDTVREDRAEKEMTQSNDTWQKEGIERASTAYACNALWGVTGIETAEILAARLKHTGKPITDEETVSYYQTAALQDLKRKYMPFGTVLIFVAKLAGAEKITAFATGNKDEYKYYDPSQNKAVCFNLSDKNSPISSDYGLLAAFVPRFDSDPAYFNSDRKEKWERDEKLADDYVLPPKPPASDASTGSDASAGSDAPDAVAPVGSDAPAIPTAPTGSAIGSKEKSPK